MSNPMEDIKDSIEAELVGILPADYQKLAYLEDVEKNNWKQIDQGYGVRGKALNETAGVTKTYTMLQVFEVVLTKRYNQSLKNEDELQQTSFDLRGLCFDIYKKMVNDHAGLPGTVMNVSGLFIAEPEPDDEAKVITQRMEFNILYRISLI